MVAESELTDRVREALSGVSDVREKKMFGSIAFMVNGRMCVTARDSRIMCRVDPVDMGKLTRMEGCRPAAMKSGRTLNGYVHVDRDVLKTRKDLDFWIRTALKYNEASKV